MDAAQNIASRLKTVVAAHPDRTALSVGGESISYQMLWSRITHLSAGLQRVGVGREDRAICMIPMSMDLYVAMLALLKNGTAVVFVDPWLGRKVIAGMASYAEPSAWIGIAKSHLLRLMDARLRKIPVSITTGSGFAALLAGTTLRKLESGAADEDIEAQDAASHGLITFTSGSSGIPKGANRTHGFLLAQHAALRETFPYEDEDIDMPMFPVFALNNLAWGIPSIVPDIDFKKVAAADGARLYEQMTTHGVTTSTASPPFFDRLCDHLEQTGAPAPSLRRILTGGAPVSDEQLRRWQKNLPETGIVVVYGSTEAEPVAHIHAAERLERKSTVRPDSPGFCTGRPVSAVEAAVIRISEGPVADLEGMTLSTGEIGELIVTGQHVCRDYFRNPDAGKANKIHSEDGRVWHRMGDTGYFDAEGYFWLTGRVHSTILRDGEMHHPQLIEQAAFTKGIRQCAAVGFTDDSCGNRIVLVIAGEDVDVNLVQQRIRQAGLRVDEIITRSEALPVDPRHNSKIDYERLREELQRHG